MANDSHLYPINYGILISGIVNLTLITESKATNWSKFSFFDEFSKPMRPLHPPKFETDYQ
jgi:hypothetical protein